MINIVEILKDCPKGTKLYSPLCGDCELNISNKFITVISRGREYTFDEYGCFMGSPECLLFPSKENRDWNTFQPFKVGPNFKDGNWITNGEYTWKVISVDNFDYTLQNQLGEYVEDTIDYVNKAFHLWTIKDAKAGDVIFYDDGWTCIFKRIHGIWFSSYCFITCDGEFHTGYEEHAVDSTINGNAHPATKEQCNLLFQKMEEAGYKWNSETNTLENPIETKFKDGDIISDILTNSICVFKGEGSVNGTVDFYCGICCNEFFIKDNIDPIKHFGYIKSYHLATEKEKQKFFDDIKSKCYKWNSETKTLERLPKFKVGDIITTKNPSFVYKIINITDTHYTLELIHGVSIYDVLIREDEYWELAPNKFDISTLKAYDKVLVRDDNNSVWINTFFGFCDTTIYKKCPFVAGSVNWSQCIPYWGNEHLLGTRDDCDEFYKNW